MNTDKPDTSAEHTKIQEALAALEKILEIMPDDQLALETLYEAAFNAGDSVKALQYLLRLTDVAIKTSDTESAEHLIEQLNFFADFYPEAREKIEKLRNLTAIPAEERLTAVSTAQPAPSAKKNVAGELALAWRLFEYEQLTQDEYSRIISDLTELSSRQTEEPVSVLHVMQDRGLKSLESIMAFMAKKSGKPVISLANFEIPKALHTLMPIKMIVQHGVLIFEKMGNELLVAVLNPFDTEHTKLLRDLTGLTPHFYLCSSSDFNTALGTIRKAVASQAKIEAAAATT